MKAIVHMYKIGETIVIGEMEITKTQKVATFNHFRNTREAEIFASHVNSYFRNARGEQVYTAVRSNE